MVFYFVNSNEKQNIFFIIIIIIIIIIFGENLGSQLFVSQLYHNFDMTDDEW